VGGWGYSEDRKEKSKCEEHFSFRGKCERGAEKGGELLPEKRTKKGLSWRRICLGENETGPEFEKVKRRYFSTRKVKKNLIYAMLRSFERAKSLGEREDKLRG